MNGKILCLLITCLMVLSLVVAACGTAETTPTTPTSPTTPITPTSPATQMTPTTPTEEKPQQEVVKPGAEKPKYGGWMNFPMAADITNWDPNRLITGTILNLTSQQLWEGDWAKGPAGGYGTNETDWGWANNDLFDLKKGYMVESWKWSADTAKNEGTIVYQVRQGVHWALNPKSEASRLVNGREMTTDDVVFSIKRSVDGSYPDAFIYRGNVELRTAAITRTGDWEITVRVPLPALITAISRFGDSTFVVPPEIIAKYGDMNKWQNNVGTGPFMITEYIPGSVATLSRNPRYWQTNPVGPGKGDQLPYMDGVRLPIIPDASTRQAALRVGKSDWLGNLTPEDAGSIKKTAPVLLEFVGTSFQGRGTPCFMRIDKPPFNDIRVRKAMMMATDFQSLLQDYRGGKGQIITYPFSRVRGYEALHVALDDPDFPEEAKELYVYNPEKAKQLLKEAGYPTGFKTSIILASNATTQIDYYSIVKDMWAKVGVELVLDLRDSTVVSNIQRARTHEGLITNTTGPVAIFYVGNPVQGVSSFNLSMIDDPIINNAMIELRLAGITDMHQAMKIFREKIFKYCLTQAYAVPDVIGSYHNLWWPWIKNYSGEITIGYDNNNWQTFVWYDEELKKSMGY